jgi:hypothetical protein
MMQQQQNMMQGNPTGAPGTQPNSGFGTGPAPTQTPAPTKPTSQPNQ